MEEADLDCCLLAGRHTLLDRDAEDSFLSLAEERGVDIIVAGVFNSGILATGTAGSPKFNYVDAPATVIERVKRLETVCARFGVPLGAAAIQFPLRQLAISAVVVGARNAAEVHDNIACFERPIPSELWLALEEARTSS